MPKLNQTFALQVLTPNMGRWQTANRGTSKAMAQELITMLNSVPRVNLRWRIVLWQEFDNGRQIV